MIFLSYMASLWPVLASFCSFQSFLACFSLLSYIFFTISKKKREKRRETAVKMMPKRACRICRIKMDFARDSGADPGLSWKKALLSYISYMALLVFFGSFHVILSCF